jgi:hypothetical protein
MRACSSNDVWQDRGSRMLEGNLMRLHPSRFSVGQKCRCQQCKTMRASVTRPSGTKLPCVLLFRGLREIGCMIEVLGEVGYWALGRVVWRRHAIHANWMSWSWAKCCAINPAGTRTFGAALTNSAFLVAIRSFAGSQEHTCTYIPRRRARACYVCIRRRWQQWGSATGNVKCSSVRQQGSSVFEWCSGDR